MAAHDCRIRLKVGCCHVHVDRIDTRFMAAHTIPRDDYSHIYCSFTSDMDTIESCHLYGACENVDVLVEVKLVVK